MKIWNTSVLIFLLVFNILQYIALVQDDTGKSNWRWVSSGDVELTCWPETLFNFWHIRESAPHRYNDLYCILGATSHGYPWRL